MNASGQEHNSDNDSSVREKNSGSYEPARALRKKGQSRYARLHSGGGKVQKWVIGKPRFAGVLPEDPTSPKVERLNVPAVISRLVLLALGTAIVVGFAMWVILGLTVLPTVQAGNSLYLTSRTAWTEGAAPNGALATDLGKPVERSMYSRLVALFNSNPDDKNSIVKIVNRDMSGNYLVTCEVGACEAFPPGTVFPVPIGNILGETTARMWFIGIEKL